MARDQFRERVLARDRHTCVICGRGEPLDAHHILERRLFDDGGYYLDNGATLCDGRQELGDFYPGCHMLAEQTVLSCADIRLAAGIRHIVLPEHFYGDLIYDKWGNIINPDGTRIRGELFQDESAQKVLAAGGKLNLFLARVKYPRTYHLPWSPGITDDDRALPDTRCFEGRRVIITEKMDGENTTMYSDFIHARSTDGGSHPSRAWVKNLHAQISADIPCGWRVCGENLFAQHTLHYRGLPSYFLMFSIWDASGTCLSWDETLTWAGLLGLPVVPLLYDGPWDEGVARAWAETLDLNTQEGYVVRVADAFPRVAFRRSVAKFVRQQHVGTAHHWLARAVVRNELREA